MGIVALLVAHATLAAPPAEKCRGLAWVGGPQVSAREVEPLLALGANWIAQTPFGWMRAPDVPEVRLATSNRVYWGESDQGLKAKDSSNTPGRVDSIFSNSSSVKPANFMLCQLTCGASCSVSVPMT